VLALSVSTKMYSTWSFSNTNTNVPKYKASNEHAQQERDRRSNAIELVNVISNEVREQLSPLSSSEILSALFRQRGIPCMDSFTYMILGKFRSSFGFHPHVDGDERKFMPLLRWHCPDVVATLWTIEPVISTLIMRGNSIDVSAALETYHSDLVCIEPMSMTTHSTMAKSGNELWGRWAGWILWRAGVDQGWSDSSCLSCNMSSNLFAMSIETKNGNLIHFAMTPETIGLIGTYARNMSSTLGVTVSMTSHTSTKLKIQPSANRNTATSLRLFGNGSMQFCGSPSDIESLYSAAFSIVKRVVESEPYEFMSSMRQMRSFVT